MEKYMEITLMSSAYKVYDDSGGKIKGGNTEKKDTA